MATKPYRELPLLVTNILSMTNGWLVGGMAEWYVKQIVNKVVDKNKPNDIDIIIPPSRFIDACKLLNIRDDTLLKLNSFGGIKFKEGNYEIDIWAQSLEDFLSNTNIPDSCCFRLVPYTVIDYRRMK